MEDAELVLLEPVLTQIKAHASVTLASITMTATHASQPQPQLVDLDRNVAAIDVCVFQGTADTLVNVDHAQLAHHLTLESNVFALPLASMIHSLTPACATVD